MNLHNKYAPLYYFEKLVEGNEEGQNNLKRLRKFIDKLQELEDRNYKTLLYLAEQISKGDLDDFVFSHFNKDAEDIIADMEYEMEENFVDDNDGTYDEPKRIGDYL